MNRPPAADPERATGSTVSTLELFFDLVFVFTLPILGGIVVIAAGLKLAAVHYDQADAASTAWLLAAGVATYVFGLALFRRVLHAGSLWVRMAMATLALATAVVGLRFSPLTQIATLVAILVVGAVSESVRARH